MLPLVLLAMAPPLEAPWPCGDSFVVSQGNGGATSHTGTEQYAWDFDLDEGDPILAAAGGTVSHLRKDSTIGGCSSSYGNDANYVVIDHGDGTSALYLHMAPYSSPLSLGQSVSTGDFIGRVGLTGWVCGDHLHIQVQQNCGSWYCQSVAASFTGAGVPGYLDAVGSGNCPGCGASLSGGTTEIESSDLACFEGLQPAWGDSPQGQGGHHFHALASNAASGTGQWHFGVSTPGDYEVLVHVPGGDASATGATYLVHHADGTDQVAVNQDAQKGWQSLGVYPFTGGDQRVELSNATGDDPGAGRRVAFDAVRFEHVPSAGDDGNPGDDGPSSDDGGSTGDGGGATGGPGPGSASAEGGGDDSGGASGLPPGGTGGVGATEDAGDDAWDGATEGGGNALPGWDPDGTTQGCACRSSTTNSPPSVVALLVLLAGIGRRRRRS